MDNKDYNNQTEKNNYNLNATNTIVGSEQAKEVSGSYSTKQKIFAWVKAVLTIILGFAIGGLISSAISFNCWKNCTSTDEALMVFSFFAPLVFTIPMAIKIVLKSLK